MYQKKSSNYDHIPTQILVENSNTMSPYITEVYNRAKSNAVFPSADITPAHKRKR